MRRDGGPSKTIWASELAQLGVCEHRLVLARRLGNRETLEASVLKRRGIGMHEYLHLQSLVVKPSVGTSSPRPSLGPGCWIATAVFGEHAPETRALRRFRDTRLTKTAAGRATIAAYYRLSPGIAAYLYRHPFTRLLIRGPLRLVAIICASFLEKRD